MRSIALAVLSLALGGLNFCNTTQTVISPDNHGSGGPTGGTNICEGLVVQLNLDIEEGLQGGVAKVGVPVRLSLDLRDSAGQSVPAECRQGTVTANVGPAEVCVTLGTPTFESISVAPVAAGICSVDAGVGVQRSNTRSFTVQ